MALDASDSVEVVDLIKKIISLIFKLKKLDTDENDLRYKSDSAPTGLKEMQCGLPNGFAAASVLGTKAFISPINLFNDKNQFWVKVTNYNGDVKLNVVVKYPSDDSRSAGFNVNIGADVECDDNENVRRIGYVTTTAALEQLRTINRALGLYVKMETIRQGAAVTMAKHEPKFAKPGCER